MWSQELEKLLGKPRSFKDPIQKRHKDIAASLQKVTEDVYFGLGTRLHTLSKSKNLCIAGGVGLNSLANGKLYKKSGFKNIYIFGPAGDSGGALGAALYVNTNILKKKTPRPVKNLYLGTEYSDDYIRKLLRAKNLDFEFIGNDKDLLEVVSQILVNDGVVGVFRDKMEFGPRALGNRSILANPKKKKMKTLVNEIKKREEFRPFAGSVLQGAVGTLFDVPKKNYYSPFMNFCFPVKTKYRPDMRAIVHADNTCRIQTVNKSNGWYYFLIKSFAKNRNSRCS